MFIKYAHLLTKAVRDDTVDRGIDDARHILFVKANPNLEVLHLTHGVLELHITRANYQAKMWLQADHVIMDLENKP